MARGTNSGRLAERTYRFSLRILGLVDELPNNVKGWEISRQLLRSGTSIGANVREADQALSRADFIHRLSIARKKASETHYWLCLCRNMSLLSGDSAAQAITEVDELLRILSTIIKKSRQDSQPAI